ncbi:MAG: prolipoprotein diacylglyceryl transferase [Pseudolysinimonas sp.]|jgi:prolipoprotein diacylglyceryl transferase|uniref:prolipoprotein diacylglyceryl transferase n=1 Tax=Pseudolysinimonas sp. TaxID=2680009 RepID=UPI003C75BB9B
MIFPQSAASIPSPDISYIDLGPLRLHFYAIFILIGVVLAVLLTGRRIRASGFTGGEAIDIALWAVPFGIVGARLYHVVTHPGDYFYPGADLLKVLYVWEGGVAIFGAVVFGLVGIWIGTRRTKIPFLVFLDALAPGMLIAQAIGRLGNYFNQELFGSPTTLPWGLQIDPSSPAFPAGLPADTLFHPLFLYELLWNLAGAATILLVERAVFRDRRPRPGTGLSLGLYLVWYGIGRAWFEWLRLDPTELLVAGVKINLITALAAAVIGILIVVNALRGERRREPEPDRALVGQRS